MTPLDPAARAQFKSSAGFDPVELFTCLQNERDELTRTVLKRFFELDAASAPLTCYRLVELANAYQGATDWHRRLPDAYA